MNLKEKIDADTIAEKLRDEARRGVEHIEEELEKQLDLLRLAVEVQEQTPRDTEELFSKAALIYVREGKLAEKYEARGAQVSFYGSNPPYISFGNIDGPTLQKGKYRFFLIAMRLEDDDGR